MALETYRRKRKFAKTPEPSAAPAAKGPAAAGPAAEGRFVVQKHAARRLHYDLRLEVDGVLKSWAVPKGPSLNPKDKRLAVMTEHHPLEYLHFEAVIPEGNYGAGTMIVWDTGDYLVEGEKPASEQLDRGELKFLLQGEKLHGSFVLVKLKPRKNARDRGNEWLLIKHNDHFADASWDIEQHPESALTGRTIEEVKKGLPPEQGARPTAGALEGAQAAVLPEKAEPMLATLVDRPFSGEDWLFELKWDGMRALAWIRGGRCEIRSRAGRDVTGRYPEMSVLPGHLAADEALLDGELVVLDGQGRGDFERMQSRMHVERPSSALLASAPVDYYVFDILHCDGYDLRAVPLTERKRFLRRVLRVRPPVRYSDHVTESGEQLFALAGEHGAEGIVGKQVYSPYVEGRSPYWVKLKATREVDAVIGGFTEPCGGRHALGALLVGLYDGRRLKFVGGVGTGFTGKILDELAGELEPRKTKKCPFSETPATKETATWVRPELVARVKFGSWTRDVRLRAPVYLGLRWDLDAKQCRLQEEKAVPTVAPRRTAMTAGLPLRRGRQAVEQELFQGKEENVLAEIDGQPLRLSNLQKVYFPDSGLTKRDLLAHYFHMGDYLLPFLKDRPLVLNRYPNGIEGDSFYQKEAGSDTPDWMHTVAIPSEERGKEIRYYLANDLPALLYLANLGCIEQHPWSSRIDDLERPDYVFFDLDPTAGTAFARVVELARAVHKITERLGLKLFMKTSGASGFHLYLPLERSYDYSQVRTFAEIVARLVATRLPELVTLERSTAKRPEGKIYFDYSQNAYGRPLAAVYSVRPHPGAPVSTPLAPRELRKTLTPSCFTIKTLPARLKKPGDLWADFFDSRQQIELALERLSREVGGS